MRTPNPNRENLADIPDLQCGTLEVIMVNTSKTSLTRINKRENSTSTGPPISPVLGIFLFAMLFVCRNRPVVIHQDPVPRAFKIIVLAIAQGPPEEDGDDEHQNHRHRYQQI